MGKRAQVALATVLILLVAGVVAGGVAWWRHTFERVTETLPLPPKGEAAYNPLYALKIALGKDGRKAVSRQRLHLAQHPLAPADTLVLLGDPRMVPAEDVQHLLDWVAAGGHLIVSTPPPGAEIGEDGVPLLGRLGVTVMNTEPVCLGLRVAGMGDHSEFCDGRRFYFTGEDTEVSATWGDEEYGDYGYARVLHGKGSVDVLAELDFLQEDALEDGPHHALARQLLQPNWNAGGTFHLIYSASMPPLWRLLLDHAWRVLLPALLALLAWLWMRTECFGPLRPAPAPDRRSLLEHVQASGDHLYRYGRRTTLHAAVREAFERRLRQRDPYAAALDGAARTDAIARRAGMTPADVDDALRQPRSGDARDFVLRIARLLQLRTRL